MSYKELKPLNDIKNKVYNPAPVTNPINVACK